MQPATPSAFSSSYKPIAQGMDKPVMSRYQTQNTTRFEGTSQAGDTPSRFSEILAQQLPKVSVSRATTVRPESAMTLPWQEVAQPYGQQSSSQPYPSSKQASPFLRLGQGSVPQTSPRSNPHENADSFVSSSGKVLTFTPVASHVSQTQLSRQGERVITQPSWVSVQGVTQQLKQGFQSKSFGQELQPLVQQLKTLGHQVKAQTLQTVSQSWYTLTSPNTKKALLLPLQPAMAAISSKSATGIATMKGLTATTSLSTTFAPSALTYQATSLQVQEPTSLGVHLQPGHHLIQPHTVDYAQSYGSYHPVGAKLNIIG